ncbi:hypothetical protein [Streptomyces sp. NPDC093514]|uniref:hypothetical protein n=1 Tax=Streptomyces sp. NPDC093514 TaxID=3366039 RepID=UPI003813087E
MKERALIAISFHLHLGKREKSSMSRHKIPRKHQLEKNVWDEVGDVSADLLGVQRYVAGKWGKYAVSEYPAPVYPDDSPTKPRRRSIIEIFTRNKR